jgi:two-component system phosphate regulon sensor histidine kinase PhoR
MKLKKEPNMQSTPDPLTVLVVDDEKGIRDGSKRIISRMGCNALTAENGEEGLDIIEQTDVSIVLLDLKMPGIDGMEVLRRIQAMAGIYWSSSSPALPPSKPPSRP